jgi:hypothetical protein
MLLFTACGSDDDDNKKDEPKVDALTVEKLAGLWVADYAKSATENGLSWTRVVEDFLFRGDGTGYWECFLLDGNQLVGAEADRDNDATHYTISGNTVTVTRDNSIIKWTLTYADGKLTDTDEGTVYRKATTEQQTLVEQLYSDWQGINSGKQDDGSTINTDVTDTYTDEPARAPRH